MGREGESYKSQNFGKRQFITRYYSHKELISDLNLYLRLTRSKEHRKAVTMIHHQYQKGRQKDKVSYWHDKIEIDGASDTEKEYEQKLEKLDKRYRKKTHVSRLLVKGKTQKYYHQNTLPDGF